MTAELLPTKWMLQIFLVFVLVLSGWAAAEQTPTVTIAS